MVERAQLLELLLQQTDKKTVRWFPTLLTDHYEGEVEGEGGKYVLQLGRLQGGLTYLSIRDNDGSLVDKMVADLPGKERDLLVRLFDSARQQATDSPSALEGLWRTLEHPLPTA
jgi:hypothetical protein